MSRIAVATTYQDLPVFVTFGWDRVLQHCFLQIDVDGDDESPVLEPLIDMAMQVFCVPLSVEDIESNLSRVGLSLPEKAFAELRQHVDIDAGNVFVRFDLDGTRTEFRP